MCKGFRRKGAFCQNFRRYKNKLFFFVRLFGT